MPLCLVSLGSNLGDRHAALDEAFKRLQEVSSASSLRTSERHATLPIGGPSGQGEFLNAAARFHTESAPEQVLAQLLAIESQLSRERHERWAARPLDLDLLAYDDQAIRSPRLRVPHPRMTFRPFVLEPAAEVAGDWVHPEAGVSLAELLKTLRGGRDALAIVGDSPDHAIESLVRAEVTPWGLPVEPYDPESPPPKLVIDTRPSPASGARVAAPRLALEDCPAEHWHSEVRAAIACVWPGLEK